MPFWLHDRQKKSQPATKCQDRGRDGGQDKTLATDKDNLGQAAKAEIQGVGSVIKYPAFFG